MINWDRVEIDDFGNKVFRKFKTRGDQRAEYRVTFATFDCGSVIPFHKAYYSLKEGEKYKEMPFATDRLEIEGFVDFTTQEVRKIWDFCAAHKQFPFVNFINFDGIHINLSNVNRIEWVANTYDVIFHFFNDQRYRHTFFCEESLNNFYLKLLRGSQWTNQQV